MIIAKVILSISIGLFLWWAVDKMATAGSPDGYTYKDEGDNTE